MHHRSTVVNVAFNRHRFGAHSSKATGVDFELSVRVRLQAKQLHQTPLAIGVVMKGFNFFKNYSSKTEFIVGSKNLEVRHVQQDDFEHSEQPPQIDPQAPLALTYLMVGLTQPSKRDPKY